jgi:hypothetical protein
LALHLRLVEADPVASADACRAYLEPLAAWLEVVYPRADAHDRQAAAGTTLFNYVKDPTSYDPRRADLAAFLRMAARSDLWNLQRKEQRHHRGRISWALVENDEAGGNLSREEEDPARQLEQREEAEHQQVWLAFVRADFDSEEQRVLDLMLAGERRTAAFVVVLDLGGRPLAEQEREVKRMKDRIKKRLERGGPTHG